MSLRKQGQLSFSQGMAANNDSDTESDEIISSEDDYKPSDDSSETSTDDGVNHKRLFCAAIIIIGLFVSLLPNIFRLGQEGGPGHPNVNGSRHIVTYSPPISLINYTSSQNDSSVVYGCVWPLVLIASTIPQAIAFVILEQQIISSQVSIVAFILWANIFKVMSLVALFWSALIPNFGMTTDIVELLTSLGRGLYCSFSNDPSCHDCMAAGISYTLISLFGSTGTLSLLLSKYAEEGLYTAIVMSSSRPLTTVFWTLFLDSYVPGLLWQPQFNIETTMAFVGLIIICPATCLYAYFSDHEGTFSFIKPNDTQET